MITRKETPIPMEASFQLKLECEKGILKMMPLDLEEGTLLGFH
jgi:hypothetical protein